MPSRPPPADPPNPPPTPRPHRHHHQIFLPMMAGALVAAVAISIAAAVFLLYRRLLSCRAAATAPSDLKPHLDPTASSALRRFPYSQLRRATASFSPSHKLGQGGFGPVFRGALPSSGLEVAVKLMDSGSLQGDREFHNELALAAKIGAMPPSADRSSVVPPFGFCCAEPRTPFRWWWRRKAGNEEEDDDLDGHGRCRRRLLLVYDLMHNGSLQDALLDRRCPELADWSRRFSVAVDIAKGIQFLHAVCDPPVIHGDIKPSNILLDSRLSAKIADFGLARVKAGGGEEVVVEIDLEESKSPKSRMKEAAVVGEDDGAESTTTAGIGISVEEEEEGVAGIVEGEGDGVASSPPTVVLEVASTSEAGGGGFDRMSVDSGSRRAGVGIGRRKSGSVLSGKDWWWRQDNGGCGGGAGNADPGGSVKDYVVEWIRSEIKKERPKSDWMAATAPAVSAEDCLPRSLGRSDNKRKQQKRMEWWASLDEERLKKEKKSRPAREWWREEFCEELTNKQQQKRRMINKSKSSIGVEQEQQQQWWQKDEDDDASPPPSEEGKKKKRRKRKKMSWSRGSRTSMDWWMDGTNGEMRTAGVTGRRSSRDWACGDIPKSGTVSSTPSMRGTVCYVAPEYGGGGPLSEKCDIYSFGVLLLVVVSGRRPLQVTASPMSEFERANLISWARHLAHLGRLLDLLDPSLRAVDRDQALLCITVALLCIQRSPARRPSIKEVVAMLTGQSEPPHLPLEFSPSPPGGFSFKSRKKAR